MCSQYKAALEVRLVGDIPVGLGVSDAGVDDIIVGMVSVESNDAGKVDMVTVRNVVQD